MIAILQQKALLSTPTRTPFILGMPREKSPAKYNEHIITVIDTRNLMGNNQSGTSGETNVHYG
ncbi:MAG: hypothetical protein KDE31_19610, partial [Caldilineaceae bacterium]|nr:hypothetical protein [Caldilineaceae bacterium]